MEMTDNQKPPVRPMREVALSIVALCDKDLAGGVGCPLCEWISSTGHHDPGCAAAELWEALDRQLPTSGRVFSVTATCSECQSVGGMLEHRPWCETGHLEMRNRLLDQDWRLAKPESPLEHAEAIAHLLDSAKDCEVTDVGAEAEFRAAAAALAALEVLLCP